MFRLDFTTGTRTQNGFGVELDAGRNLVGTATIENESSNGQPRTFWLLALLDGLQSPVLTRDRRDVVSVRGPRATVQVRVPARHLSPGAHRLTMVLVDSDGDDPAVDRAPFETRALTYDVVAERPGPPPLAAHEAERPTVLPGGGPFTPFVVDRVASNYLKTRYVADRPLFAKVGTASRGVTHFIALVIDGRQHAWEAGRPGLLRVPAEPNDVIVLPLPLHDLAPGQHRVAVVTLPDLDRTFFDRRQQEVGGRTFLVTTGG